MFHVKHYSPPPTRASIASSWPESFLSLTRKVASVKLLPPSISRQLWLPPNSKSSSSIPIHKAIPPAASACRKSPILKPSTKCSWAMQPPPRSSSLPISKDYPFFPPTRTSSPPTSISSTPNPAKNVSKKQSIPSGPTTATSSSIAHPRSTSSR